MIAAQSKTLWTRKSAEGPQSRFILRLFQELTALGTKLESLEQRLPLHDRTAPFRLVAPRDGDEGTVAFD
jgi:hypothetical protein